MLLKSAVFFTDFPRPFVRKWTVTVALLAFAKNTTVLQSKLLYTLAVVCFMGAEFFVLLHLRRVGQRESNGLLGLEKTNTIPLQKILKHYSKKRIRTYTFKSLLL